MLIKHNGLAEWVRDEMKEAMKNGSEDDAMDAAVCLVMDALKIAEGVEGSLLEAVPEIIDGALQGALQSCGSDGNLEPASRAIILGVLRRTRKMQIDMVDTLEGAANSIVETTAKRSGDVASAARGAIQGAAQGAKEIGRNVREAVAAAVAGVLHALPEIPKSEVEVAIIELAGEAA